MKLLIDIGNTCIKWGYDTGRDISGTGSVVHRGVAPETAMQFIADLRNDVDSVGVVNVAGALMADALMTAIRQRFDVVPEFVHTTEHCAGVSNGYKAVEQLGTDRWAAIVGAWDEFRADVCVVDAGTAVTIDLVNGHGSHLGGIILPGLGLMAASLNKDTSDIQSFAQAPTGLVGDADWYGRDTASAVQRGAHFALRAAVMEAAHLHGSKARLVITGGDADRLMPLGDCRVERRPDLVLSGLRQLLKEQAGA
jgi:type III pantothenate kinase